MVEAKRLQRLFDRACDTRRNCRFDDVERLLRAIGFDVRYTRGSHAVFTLGVNQISIPSGSPVNRAYVERVIKASKEILHRG